MSFQYLKRLPLRPVLIKRLIMDLGPVKVSKCFKQLTTKLSALQSEVFSVVSVQSALCQTVGTYTAALGAASIRPFTRYTTLSSGQSLCVSTNLVNFHSNNWNVIHRSPWSLRVLACSNIFLVIPEQFLKLVYCIKIRFFLTHIQLYLSPKKNRLRVLMHSLAL